MEFRLLGPVEVWAASELVDAGPPRQRAVLAALLVDAGRPVMVDTVVDRVWGQAPPARARHALYVYVARIRRVLERAGAEDDQLVRLVRRSRGYLLDVDPERVDVHRFGRLVRQGCDLRRVDHERVALLRQALDLWRGTPLADLPGEWVSHVREGWRRQRLDAVTEWAPAELRVGDASAVIGRLTAMVDEYPLVEPLTAALMHALHTTGLAAEALDCYTVLRRRLAEELGIDPGPELQKLHRAILRNETAVRHPRAAAGPAVPRQLPAPIQHFVGRAEELKQLTGLLDMAALSGRAVVISAIVGAGGIGKTALAVHWAHLMSAKFPDGQLYVNLRGYDPDQPMAAGDALTRVLTALGVADRDIPLEVDERAARYRTEIAGRRMLIVLDNVATVEQVRPLLPGTASGPVLVTSRDSLAGLVAVHGAYRMELGLLPPGDAVTLLQQLIGPRAEAEPEAVAALAEHCARLPLALRVAAELAVSRPTTPLADLVTELADQQQRLRLLDAGGDPRAAVRAVFSWSVRHLSPDAGHTFGRLGLHPGPDFDAYAAAVLADTGIDQARHILDVLARAHLVHPVGPGRFGMHDLLRAYATHLATTGNGSDDPGAALGRLFDYYLTTAAAAMHTRYPAEAHYRPDVPPPSTATPTLADPDTARGWLDAERPVLVAVAAHSAAHGWPAHTIRLATTLFRYLDGGHHTDALAIHAHAWHAAQQAGDQTGQAHARFGLGAAHGQLGHYDQAAAHLQQAVALFQRAGDQTGQARALNSLGIIDWRLGHYGPAAEHHEQALALFQRAGDQTGQARALGNLGYVEWRLGHHGPAAEHHEQALVLVRQTGDRNGEASALNGLGLIEQQLGHNGRAAEHLQQALALYQALGHRTGEAHALDNLGMVHTHLGQPEQAAGHFERALTLFRGIGDRDGEAMVLNGLGEAVRTAGHPANAIPHHAAALAISTEIGARDQQARAHSGLGHADRTLGNPGSARAHYAHALALYTQLGMPDADDIRADLAGLDTSPAGQ